MANFIQTNLVLLRGIKDLTQAKAATALGFKRNTYANYESGHTQPNIEAIKKISSFFGIKTDDLLFTDLREVNLNRENSVNKNSENVNLNVNPSVNLNAKNREMLVLSDEIELYRSHKGRVYDLSSSAAAGLPSILQDDDKRNDLPFFTFPELGNGKHIRIRITGDSMESTIKNGDFVIATEVQEVPANLRGGSIYVFIDVEDGVQCKRLYVRDKGMLEIVSDNAVYEPYKRHLSHIHSVFKVVQVHTSNLSNGNSAANTEIQSLRKEIADIQRQMHQAMESKKN